MIQGLIESSRPKTLLAGAAPILLGSAYSYAKFNNFKIEIFLLTLFCTIFLQIGTNVVNEYFDFKTGVDQSNRLGPKRSLQKGSVSSQNVKRFYIFCFAISFILGLKLMYIGGPLIVGFGLTSLLVAYCYTGGPIPLSHIYMGELLAFTFFGPVAVIGTSYLQNNIINLELIKLSMIPGFISAMLMSLNNLRDIETDKNTNKKTIAILIGVSNARKLTIAAGLAPVIVCAFLLPPSITTASLVIFVPPFLFFKLWKKILQTKQMTELNEGISLIGKYNVVYCVTISTFYLFIK